MHFRDWVGQKVDEMDKLSYDVQALIEGPSQQVLSLPTRLMLARLKVTAPCYSLSCYLQDPQACAVTQDLERLSHVNEELLANTAKLGKELANFSTHASDTDMLHNVLLTQLMSAVQSMRSFHAESLQVRETLQVRDGELYEAKQEAHALKLAAGGEVVKQVMATDMCQFEDAVNEILFEKEVGMQGVKSALETAERKVAKLQLQLKKSQNEAHMFRDQLTTVQMGQGAITEDGKEKSAKELHECRVSLNQAKELLSKANGEVERLTQEAQKGVDVHKWINEQAESRSSSEADTQKLISSIQVMEEKKMADTVAALRKDHATQMKNMQLQCKTSFRNQKAAEDSLLTVNKMSDRGSLVAEVENTRNSNERLVKVMSAVLCSDHHKKIRPNLYPSDSAVCQVTAKLGGMLQEKEKLVAQRESDVAVANQRIKELEDQIGSMPEDAGQQTAASAAAAAPASASTQGADEDGIYNNRLTRELEQVKTEKRLAITDLEAEIKHVKELKLNRIAELETQLQEVIQLATIAQALC